MERKGQGNKRGIKCDSAENVDKPPATKPKVSYSKQSQFITSAKMDVEKEKHAANHNRLLDSIAEKPELLETLIATMDKIARADVIKLRLQRNIKFVGDQV